MPIDPQSWERCEERVNTSAQMPRQRGVTSDSGLHSREGTLGYGVRQGHRGHGPALHTRLALDDLYWALQYASFGSDVAMRLEAALQTCHSRKFQPRAALD